MKNIPRTPCVRRRLALLLLVSIINFIVAPFLLASRSAAAPLNVLSPAGDNGTWTGAPHRTGMANPF